MVAVIYRHNGDGLFEGQHPDDLAEVDQEATRKKYNELCERALAEAFGSAEVVDSPGELARKLWFLDEDNHERLSWEGFDVVDKVWEDGEFWVLKEERVIQ